MAQLVERRVRNAKVRGSNPLISTTKISCKRTIFFLCGKGDSHDFIVVLLCNTNPYGLTLLRKRPGRFLRIPLISTTKNTSRPLFGLFYFCGGISGLCDFSKIAPRFHRANLFGLITNEERRKRVAFADIECSLIANKSDTKCPRKAQCNARFVERRRSEK